MEPPSDLPSTHTIQLWVQDAFGRVLREYIPQNATGTFIKRRGRKYIVTAGHVANAVHAQRAGQSRAATIAMRCNTTILNLATIPSGSIRHSLRSAAVDNAESFPDVAVAPLNDFFQTVLFEQSHKVPIDLDAWSEPHWPSVQYCLVAGYPDEHKEWTQVGKSSGIKSLFVTPIVELASTLDPGRPTFTLMNTMKAPHGYHFSGMSGGPVYAIDPDEHADSTMNLTAIGIVFEGHPGSRRPDDLNASGCPGFLTDHDVFFRVMTLTPTHFDGWLRNAGLLI